MNDGWTGLFDKTVPFPVGEEIGEIGSGGERGHKQKLMRMGLLDHIITKEWDKQKITSWKQLPCS